MTDLFRLRVVWSGAAVTGGGVSTFYASGPSAAAFQAAVKSFFTTAVVNMPSSCSVTVPNTGEVINDATGGFVSTWTGGTVGNLIGTDPGVFAAGVGMRVVWNTSGTTGRRRVRGSTFLCPMGAGQYDSSGTINNSSRGTLEIAAQALVTALTPGLTIWTRAVGGSGGKSSTVTSATIPDKVSWLVSRRT